MTLIELVVCHPFQHRRTHKAKLNVACSLSVNLFSQDDSVKQRPDLEDKEKNEKYYDKVS